LQALLVLGLDQSDVDWLGTLDGDILRVGGLAGRDCDWDSGGVSGRTRRQAFGDEMDATRIGRRA
jgi:hypothetical protein